MKKRKIIVIIIALVLAIVGIALMQQTDKSQPSIINTSPQPTSNSTQQSIPPSGTESNLEECLKSASNSDANQEIIKQAQQDCYNRFR